MVEGVSRLNLYTKRGPKASIGINAIDKGAMAMLDSLETPTKAKTANTPQVDELTQLKTQIKKQTAIIEQMRKKQNAGTEGKSFMGWQRRKCRPCFENKNPDCRHCWLHYPVMFDDCKDPLCIQKKERRTVLGKQ